MNTIKVFSLREILFGYQRWCTPKQKKLHWASWAEPNWTRYSKHRMVKLKVVLKISKKPEIPKSVLLHPAIHFAMSFSLHLSIKCKQLLAFKSKFASPFPKTFWGWVWGVGVKRCCQINSLNILPYQLFIGPKCFNQSNFGSKFCLEKGSLRCIPAA